MALAIGLDVHRAQITFHTLNEETGEVKTGQAPGEEKLAQVAEPVPACSPR